MNEEENKPLISGGTSTSENTPRIQYGSIGDNLKPQKIPDLQKRKSPQYTFPAKDMTKEALLIDAREKWNKSFHSLPVAIDLPRFAKKMEIYRNGRLFNEYAHFL